jgi:hypothetical protein
MSAWVVIPSLLKLRDEFNLVSPKRDKGSDGTIGDSSHTSSSDHTPDESSSKLQNKDADHTNEVHALDIDSTGPWPDGKRGDTKGSWFDQKIHMIIATEKKRWQDPKDMCRLNYIIWCGIIYDKDNDWVGVPYHGSADPHTGHAHFSARYETRAESDIRSWGVYVPPKPVSPPSEELPVDGKTFNALFLGALKDPAIRVEVGKAMLEANIGSVAVPQRTVKQGLVDLTSQLRPIFTFPPGHVENVKSGLPMDAPVRALLAMPDAAKKFVADDTANQ